MKTKVIAFVNNKGGSGKTTTCSNVACALSLLGKRVLAIDGDMQLNLTISYFDENAILEFAKNGRNIHSVVKGEEDLFSAVVPSGYDGLDLVPASPLLSGVEYDIYPKEHREYVLKECMKNLKEKGGYDYILIDAPPTLGGWVTNILCASDYVIIPTEASPWGLFGLANMFEFCRKIKKSANTPEILGIVVTKADERKKYFKQTIEALKNMHEVRIFENYVRLDSAIEWSQENSKPVVVYKKKSRSAVEYFNLAKEILSYADR